MAGQGRDRGRLRVREKPAQGYASPSLAAGLTGVLFDSDVVIRLLRGYEDVSAQFRELRREGVPVYSTAIAWAEVFAGLRRGEERVARTFFELCGEVVIDARSGRLAGEYLARYARSHALGIADALVAASASTSGLHLWTFNRKHYPMKDVRFYDPK
ncbi:MAG: type II toxin-antitoxin system VapC family toxin [Candidatus Eisenbacteria bacterium]|uniref:Type II toxin-antitoxin system VapC family toxin n=1 Tax=Eiseniibacteriota bacterium TaxID=2212470 RepID=A0A933SF81_UNCEI|nr:type II toxin-antitoxin system VapC family toxin [Candidatus Eisenbacteria bacterium]